MSDQPPVPVQQAPAPVQQTIDWEQRYKGASQKINELMTQISTLQGQLQTASSEIEQLRSGLSIKDVEKDAAIQPYKTQLEQALSAKTAAESELSGLRALKAKLDAAKELNATSLFPVLDKIPHVDNPDAQKEIMKTFMDWGNDLVKQREQQLLAGVTPPPPAASSVAAKLPATVQEWQAYVNGIPLGTPEREKAMQDWWKWGQAQQGR